MHSISSARAGGPARSFYSQNGNYGLRSSSRSISKTPKSTPPQGQRAAHAVGAEAQSEMQIIPTILKNQKLLALTVQKLGLIGATHLAGRGQNKGGVIHALQRPRKSLDCEG